MFWPFSSKNIPDGSRASKPAIHGSLLGIRSEMGRQEDIVQLEQIVVRGQVLVAKNVDELENVQACIADQR